MNDQSAKTLTANEIKDMVMEIHLNEEDWDEGDLEDRIYSFKQYIEQSIDTSTLQLDEFYIEEEHVEEFKGRIQKGEVLKPIVYDPVNGSIIDGNHRANAYHALGMTNITAYVGNPETYDPY